MITRRWLLAGLIATAIPSLAAHAGPAPQAAAEIDYLLWLVGSSGCEFNRNGTWYDSKRAEEHLRLKYAYLVSHDKVTTAEDFIERAATKSSLSGRPYLLRCGGDKVLTSEAWLRAALAHHRLPGAH